MELVFREDAYAAECEATVLAVGPEGVVLDRTVFYPTGGGQPGDSGVLVAADETQIAVAEAVKGPGPDDVLHRLADGVTGGQVGAEKSRLDFDSGDHAYDKEELTEKINALILEDYPVTQRWIDESELDANPEMVRTLSVQPPRGTGRIRLMAVGDGVIDLQPCGGTHVASTGEIGRVRISKIENKGKRNRRIHIVFDE